MVACQVFDIVATQIGHVLIGLGTLITAIKTTKMVNGKRQEMREGERG